VRNNYEKKKQRETVSDGGKMNMKKYREKKKTLAFKRRCAMGFGNQSKSATMSEQVGRNWPLGARTRGKIHSMSRYEGLEMASRVIGKMFHRSSSDETFFRLCTKAKTQKCRKEEVWDV
jgi:hypothetical protein